MFQQTKCALKEAEDQQTACDKELAGTERKKADLEDILQGTFQSLKEGSVEKSEATKLASDLVTRTQGLFNLNETLATTVPSALGKEPTARGPFDTIAIQHLQEELDKSLREWNALIRDSDKVKASHAANVQTKHEEFKAAKERQLESAEAFNAIRKEIEENDTLLQETKKNLRRMSNVQRQAEKKLKEAQDKLDAFRQGPLSVFAELRDRDQLDFVGNNPSGATDNLSRPETAVPMEVA